MATFVLVLRYLHAFCVDRSAYCTNYDSTDDVSMVADRTLLVPVFIRQHLFLYGNISNRRIGFLSIFSTTSGVSGNFFVSVSR